MRWSHRSSDLDRRDFLRLAGLGSAAALTRGLGLPLHAAATYDPAACSLMEFDVSYRTQIRSLPSDAEDVQIWIPLPPSDAAQQISNFEVDSPVPVQTMSDTTFGTRMLHAATRELLEPFSVEVRYRVTRTRGGIRAATLGEAESQKYLQLTQRVRVTDDVEAFAREFIGDATDPLEVGRRVFDGIGEVLFYDSSIPGCGTGDTAWIMRHRRGKCDDYHALFMAVMISRGIPIRWEQGFPLPFPENGISTSGQLEGDCTGSHCWLSFYTPSQGWVPVDVSEADKAEHNGEFFFGRLSPNRFQVSVGRSVTLNPTQGGDPLSTFAFAYAESDGIPLIYAMNYENIIKYTVTRVEMS